MHCHVIARQKCTYFSYANIQCLSHHFGVYTLFTVDVFTTGKLTLSDLNCRHKKDQASLKKSFFTIYEAKRTIKIWYTGRIFYNIATQKP